MTVLMYALTSMHLGYSPMPLVLACPQPGLAATEARNALLCSHLPLVDTPVAPMFGVDTTAGACLLSCDAARLSPR
jgi:hypothetical protein